MALEDQAPPKVTVARLAPDRFRVRRNGRGGAVLRIELSEPARLRLTIEQRRRGRWRSRGTLWANGVQGRNRIRITGRMGERELPGGRYRLVGVAIDASGKRTTIPRRRFEIY